MSDPSTDLPLFERLAACAIRPLAASELKKPLRWLRAGEETLIGADADSVITVRDALFFEQLGDDLSLP